MNNVEARDARVKAAYEALVQAIQQIDSANRLAGGSLDEVNEALVLIMAQVREASSDGGRR